MPANKFHRAKLTLYSLQLKHHRSEEPRGPGPVCPCRTPVTSTSPCRSKFCTWPFLIRWLLYSTLSWLELMQALGTPMPEQQHTSDRPFCQTAISCSQTCGIFIRILSIHWPLYLSLAYHLKWVSVHFKGFISVICRYTHSKWYTVCKHFLCIEITPYRDNKLSRFQKVELPYVKTRVFLLER